MLNEAKDYCLRPSVSASQNVADETPYMTSCCRVRAFSMGSVILQHRPSVPLPGLMSDSVGHDSI